MPSEQKGYALTGRVVDAKVETDGDIHIALQDASGRKRGNYQCRDPPLARSGVSPSVHKVPERRNSSAILLLWLYKLKLP